MALQRLFLVVMSLAVSCYVMPEAWADGDRATPAEARDYAQREADSKVAEEFVGGGATGLLVAIIIIAAIVIVVWYLIDSKGHAKASPPVDGTKPDTRNATVPTSARPATP